METTPCNFQITLVHRTGVSRDSSEKEYALHKLPAKFQDLITDVISTVNPESNFNMSWYDFDDDTHRINNDADYWTAIEYAKRNGISDLRIIITNTVSKRKINKLKVPQNFIIPVKEGEIIDCDENAKAGMHKLKSIEIHHSLSYLQEEQSHNKPSVSDPDLVLIAFDDSARPTEMRSPHEVMVIPRSEDKFKEELKKIGEEIKFEASGEASSEKKKSERPSVIDIIIDQELFDPEADNISEFNIRNSITSASDFRNSLKKSHNQDRESPKLEKRPTLTKPLNKEVPDLKEQLKRMVVVEKIENNIGALGTTVTQKWKVTNESDHQWPSDLFLH